MAAGLIRTGRRPAWRRETAMRKIGLKALTAILTIGRYSRRHVDWTWTITVFSTFVTVALVALYVLDRFGGL
jgi:hypothetical protein